VHGLQLTPRLRQHPGQEQHYSLALLAASQRAGRPIRTSQASLTCLCAELCGAGKLAGGRAEKGCRVGDQQALIGVDGLEDIRAASFSRDSSASWWGKEPAPEGVSEKMMLTMSPRPSRSHAAQSSGPPVALRGATAGAFGPGELRRFLHALRQRASCSYRARKRALAVRATKRA
jgi:hypothetical protein